jgi:hypothetical protein
VAKRRDYEKDYPATLFQKPLHPFRHYGLRNMKLLTRAPAAISDKMQNSESSQSSQLTRNGGFIYTPQFLDLQPSKLSHFHKLNNKCILAHSKKNCEKLPQFPFLYSTRNKLAHVAVALIVLHAARQPLSFGHFSPILNLSFSSGHLNHITCPCLPVSL